MANRKKYGAEFKREAVGVRRQPGIRVRQVARDSGILRKPAESLASGGKR